MFPDRLLLLLLPGFFFACTEQMRQLIRIFFAIYIKSTKAVSDPSLSCGAPSQRKTGQNLDLLGSDCCICAVVARIDVSPSHFDLNRLPN